LTDTRIKETELLLAGGTVRPFRRAYADYVAGLRRWALWGRLGWMEVKRRYRRTVIGPFWATCHIALYIACVGFIFSNVLETDRQTYIPYLGTGFIAWMLIYNMFQEAGGAFVGASSLLQQMSFPFSMFIYMVIWRNLIVNAHNYSLYIIISIFYPIAFSWHMLLLIPGYVLVVVNMGWMCMFLALMTARFRDVQQLIASIMVDSKKHAGLYKTAAYIMEGKSLSIMDLEFEELEKHLRLHIEKEQEMIDAAKGLMDEVKDERVKKILTWIYEDELFHHPMLKVLLNVVLKRETISEEDVWDMVFRDLPTHGAPGP